MIPFGRKLAVAVFSVLPFAALSVVLNAYSGGPDPRLSGAPGDDTCASCHTGAAVNSGPGSVKIVLAGAATYTPGVKQRIKVEISDPTMRRWGFELSARVASKPDSAQAGDLASVDGNVQVICDSGGAKPCADGSVVQFATHTSEGTRNGTTGGVSFELDWTPPATDVGPVTLYAAGNAANGNATNTGDRVYTTSVALTPETAVTKPTVSSIVNHGSLQPRVGANTWITINGAGLATTTKAWATETLVESRLPEAFEAVTVMVNNKAAFIQSVSPAKIIALTPADEAVGPVEVKVTANGQTSDASTVELQAFAPAVFTYNGKKVAFNRPDEPALDSAQPFPAEPKEAKNARPGETIILFGTGLGPTDPETAAGRLTETEAPLAKPVKVTIGGMEAEVSKSGLIAKLPRIYQLQVKVPDALADGDHAVIVEIEGVASRSGAECCVLSVLKEAREEIQ